MSMEQAEVKGRMAKIISAITFGIQEALSIEGVRLAPQRGNPKSIVGSE